jgi:hypothetical protein
MTGRGKEKEIGSVRENGKFHQLFQVLVLTLLQALSGNGIRNSYSLQYSYQLVLIQDLEYFCVKGRSFYYNIML